MAAAAILFFEKLEILTICPLYEANLLHHAELHRNRLTVAEIWQCNGIENDGRPPSWILEI